MSVNQVVMLYDECYWTYVPIFLVPKNKLAGTDLQTPYHKQEAVTTKLEVGFQFHIPYCRGRFIFDDSIRSLCLHQYHP